MGVQILEEEAWVPPLAGHSLWPSGSWKTSTLGCAEGAVWSDFHGSTRRSSASRAGCGTGDGSPQALQLPDLVDVVRDVAADKAAGIARPAAVAHARWA